MVRVQLSSFLCLAIGLANSHSVNSPSYGGVSNSSDQSSRSLPRCLHGNQPAGSCPWDNAPANQTNPDDVPNTGVTRKYHFVLERANLAPDGVNRSMLLINGQFPGPMIEANWGDMIEVSVENRICSPPEGSSLHWHGLKMKGTPWFDGIPSVQQCPIAPNASFTYTFQADAYGTSLYHSHYSAQYSAGLFGAMVIYGPKHQPYDIDVGTVFLTDWYHADYLDVVESVVGLPAPLTQPYSDNNLINGKMPFDCNNANVTRNNLTCTPNSDYSKFSVKSGKTHLLRLINASAQAMQRFTIDSMSMTVIANDFVPIVPYTTSMLTLGIGQRADVLIHATGSPKDALWMRSDVSTICSVSTQGHGLAAIYYEEANTNVLPNTTATSYDDSYCGNVPLSQTVPLFPQNPPPQPAKTQSIDITFKANTTGSLLWYMNNSTFYADYEHPILVLANAGNTSYPDPEWNVYNFDNSSSIRIMLINHSNTPRSSHPMHLHGHNFWIVAEGLGTWDGKANLSNPMRRDTFVLQPGDPVKGPSYMVMDFLADNPGVWPLHCHIAWHISSGLYVNIMERPDEIVNYQIPDSVRQTCRDWSAYKGVPVVPEIDSGL